MITKKIESIVFENPSDEGSGFQEIIINDESSDNQWLEIKKDNDIHYPLCLFTHKDIDDFCKGLHELLGTVKDDL